MGFKGAREKPTEETEDLSTTLRYVLSKKHLH